jgi:predicted anti-sigma-YlaC factor YlaD
MAHIMDEVLDSYVMQTLRPGLVEQVEEHLLSCEECQKRLDAAADFVESISAAASKLRAKQSPPQLRLRTACG